MAHVLGTVPSDHVAAVAEDAAGTPASVEVGCFALDIALFGDFGIAPVYTRYHGVTDGDED